jgi:hypothetical protein
LRTAGILVFYAALAAGLCFLAFAQPSGAQGYPEFFARVVAYVARGLWGIVRENAVPLSGNLVIATIFLLGMLEALELPFWVVRRFWPVPIVLSAVGIAAMLRMQVAQ